MSELDTNKQIARDCLRAISTKDLERLDQLFAANIEYVVPGSAFLSGSYNKPAIMGAMGYLWAMLENSIDFDVQSLTGEEGRISVLAKGKARTILGEEYNNTYHFLIFLERGKIVRMYEFVDLLLVEKVIKPAAQRACPEMLK